MSETGRAQRRVGNDYAIETATEDDWDDIERVLVTAFHGDRSPEASAADRLPFEFDRTLIARREGDAAGTAAICTRRLAVPGATVPAAHITGVAVLPTARRQGILTAFMQRQLHDARVAGEPIAVLWASEGRIYQRFGYGLASTRLALAIETNEVRLTLPPAPGRLREGSPAALRDQLVKLYDEVYPSRPGWSERAQRHWDCRLVDIKEWRRGATELRAVVHESDSGEVDGYALWRTQGKWTDTGPSGEVRVVEYVAANPEAYAAVWSFLMAVDLTRSVHLWQASSDEPLLHAVSDPRRLDARLGDALWLRVVDLPAALAARRYAVELDVVLDVTDTWVPENVGRWRLTGSRTSGTCVSTVDEPDLSCDVRALGAAYLGGTSLATLAATGQVVERAPGALARADLALRWHPAPSALEVF